MNASGYPKQGETWRVDLEPVVGSEIHNHGMSRPCVIISDNRFAALPVRLVVPLTSWQAKFEGKQTIVKVVASPLNGLTNDSAATAMQVRTVDMARFSSYCGRLTWEELDDVIAAVGIFMGLP